MNQRAPELVEREFGLVTFADFLLFPLFSAFLAAIFLSLSSVFIRLYPVFLGYKFSQHESNPIGEDFSLI